MLQGAVRRVQCVPFDNVQYVMMIVLFFVLLTTWRAAEHSRIAAGVSQPTGLWVFHHHCSCDLHCEFGPAGMGHCLCVRLGVETRGWALACLHEPVVCR